MPLIETTVYKMRQAVLSSIDSMAVISKLSNGCHNLPSIYVNFSKLKTWIVKAAIKSVVSSHAKVTILSYPVATKDTLDGIYLSRVVPTR